MAKQTKRTPRIRAGTGQVVRRRRTGSRTPQPERGRAGPEPAKTSGRASPQKTAMIVNLNNELLRQRLNANSRK